MHDWKGYKPRVLMAATFAVAAATSAPASVLHVDDDAPAGGNGTSWATAYRFLADALADARAAGGSITEIRVAGGVYRPDQSEAEPAGTGDRDASFELVEAASLRGGFVGMAAGKGGDPDDRDTAVHETILSGDLAGDDGPGFLNNADNSRHVVTATGVDGTAVLDGCTIAAGNADGSGPQFLGGGMLNTTADPAVIDCTFLANAAGQGGGMYNGAGSSPTVTGCTFDGNRADVSGGGMHNASNAPLITGCTFDGNTADSVGGGGVYNIAASPELVDCILSGNDTSADGGGMHNAGAAPQLIDCTFSDNSALFAGGGMYSLNSGLAAPALDGCVFAGNTSFDEGGGLYSVNSGSAPVMIECTFDGNVAVDHGGAIRQTGPAPFAARLCEFTANFAGDSGGAVSMTGSGPDSVLAQCTFTGNTAHENGGAVVTATGEATLADCSFDGNTAELDGGAVWLSGGATILDGCTLTDNAADRSGGGIRTTGGSSTVAGCELAGNFADSTGGGMHNSDGSTVAVSGCTFTGNTTGAFSGGGAMYNVGCAPVITACTFDGNTSNFAGAIYNINGGNPVVSDCLIEANTAFIGGGVFIWNSTPQFTSCVFAANTAIFSLTARGGAVNVLDADPAFSACTFDGNTARIDGGAVFLDGGNATLTDCRFTGNQAPTGGAMAIESGAPLVANCVFAGNVATGADDNPEDEIDCSTVAVGGGLRVGPAFPTIAQCTFYGNAALCAEGNGGGAAMLIGTVTNSILFNNSDAGGTDESAQLFVTGPVSVNYTCIQGLTGALGGVGNIGADPLLTDPLLGLAAGSPCIDAGDNTTVPAGVTGDIAGNPRFHDDPGTIDTGNPDGVNPIVDMGAWEFQGDSALSGDVNGDGEVGVLDLLILLGAWGPCPDPPDPCPADVDGDGNVGVTDLLAVLAAWG